MMKKIFFTLFSALLFLGLSGPVSADKVTIEKDVLDKILERQEALEKKIEMLEKRAVREKAVPETKTSDVEYLQEDVADMSERLDKVETKSILNRVTIGGEFRVRWDKFAYRDVMINGLEEDTDVNDLWSSRLRLNLKAKITDNLIFHGRLSYFKLWGISNFNSPTMDMIHPSVPDADGGIHVEKAYIDYFVPGTPLSFTFGRLPSCEGPPNELRDNTTRKGTWPQLVIDGETDGIIANLSLDNWTGLNNSMFRLVYSKLFQNYSDNSGVDLDDARAYVAAFETEIPGIKDSLAWLSYAMIKDIMAVPAIMDVPYVSSPEDVGDMDLLTFHLQFNNIKKSGLDWFGAISYIDYSPVSGGTVIAPGLEVGMWGDSLNNNLGESRDGHCIYTGLKYRLPFGSLRHPSIGLEYNHGSKYWTGMLSAGSGDIINKLGINGDAYEFYYIQPIVKNHMFLRLGVVHMDYEYYNPMLIYGTQPESDMSITNFYLITDIRF